MHVSDFHFELPEELIAQHPPAERGASRMLVMEGQGRGNREQGTQLDPALAEWSLHDAKFRELPDFLRAGDLLVLNDSRVIPARLYARRVSHPSSLTLTRVGHPEPSQELSGKIEVLLTEQVIDPANPPEQSSDWAPNIWRALVKPGRKVRVGERLEFFDSAKNEGALPTSQNRDPFDSALRPRSGQVVGHPILTAEVIASGERGERTLRFDPVADFEGVLARIGHMPLPPYIRHGQDEAEDRERYQTVYAQAPGSAAAPTAGLHFTPEILDALRARGVKIAYVTLHVGLGTFQPVRVHQVQDIRLHSERYTLPAETADALKRSLREGRRVIAVGTTTTRTLEHIAREARARFIPPEQSSDGAPGHDWIEEIKAHSGATSIFIAPGHRFRVVSGLLTNFHLPESTLLMLVSAFAADRMAERDVDTGRRAVLAAYGHAVQERYRFFSYGDCMLVL